MVRLYLSNEGFAVVQAFDGEEGARRFEIEQYDLVLLDLMLPGRSGMDVLQTIRAKSVVPVLILSAKDGDVDKALGLGFGADDYLAKPFSMIELGARVKAALRRATLYARAEAAAGAASDVASDALAASAAPKTLRLLDLSFGEDDFAVTKNGAVVALTAKEFLILKQFALHPTRVFTKAQLYRAVWNDEYYGDENVINVHMRRLREKIEDDPSTPRYIKTLWGIGYKAGAGE
ncbi:response regulator transcription factor [Paenibacillus sp. TRM 82003]|nr:response regulator transcription factor [Paenibacillus sp. TRM 82003]